MRLTLGMATMAVVLVGGTNAAPADGVSAEQVKQRAEQRADRYAERMEDYLRRRIIEGYPQRAADAWRRDYSSIEAFLASVEPNRRQWRAIINPPTLRPTGPLERRPFDALADIGGQWIALPLGEIQAEAILVLPADAAEKPAPLVIAPHGLNGVPEAIFGLTASTAYHSYGRRLVEEGFAVLAPADTRSMPSRNRLERMCRLAGTTLAGVELARLRNLLDVVLADPRIDANRVGIWGLSRGGRATMYWTPLEPRIKVAVVSAWFNHRLEKMVVPSDRYSCFLETEEEHAFYVGWLTVFADHDAVSLICPRPLMIQTGKKDTISHWPGVVEEFKQACVHYEKLGLADRIEMHLHEGGHEVVVDPGVAFLKRWLADEAPE